MSSQRNLLVHFLDKEILDLYAALRRFDEPFLKKECLSALRLGYMFTWGRVLLPIASYFESQLANDVVQEAAALMASDDMHFISSELDYDGIIEVRRERYEREPTRHPLYFDVEAHQKLLGLGPRLTLRRESSTQAIRSGWMESIERNDEVWKRLWKTQTCGSIEEFERELALVPRAPWWWCVHMGFR